VPGDQLDLSIPTVPGGSRLPARIAPMQATPGVGPFDDPAYLFEPWWPGVRALAWVEGGRLVRLQAQGLADAFTAFAELADELPDRLMADAVVLDGWLLVLDEGGWLDTGLLRRRLGGDAHAGRPGFVASDLLWSEGAAWGSGRHRRSSPACEGKAGRAQADARGRRCSDTAGRVGQTCGLRGALCGACPSKEVI